VDAVQAWIGLGANLGDARHAIAAALAAIDRLPHTRLARVSSLYRSAPVDAEGPDFLNAVAAVETALAPEALLDALQAIERSHGRERSFRNAPRTLDLDLLAFDGLSLRSARLTLPHPRMHERAFVLLPLAEVAPDLRLPGLAPLEALLAACAGQRIERALDAPALRALATAAHAPADPETPR
jgi:2-amino-4-hydroxy-6-hydroxymethyldihydropteridine diphosphokinase